MAAVLAACGRGGGGSSSTPPAASSFQLSFQPGTLAAEYYQGEPPLVNVEVRASQAYSAPVQVAVVDSTGVVGGELQVLANSTLVYTASMRLSGTLAAGTYSGALDVRVCEDAPLTCARPVPGSPWKLPYQIKVKSQTDLRPLGVLAGVPAWTGYLGGSDRNASRGLAITPASISRRWTAPAPEFGSRESMPVVDSGLVLTLLTRASGGPPVLQARRELDGTLAWSRPLGTVNDTFDSAPTVAGGQVFLFASDFVRTTAWRLDLATGALLQERFFDRPSPQQTGVLALGGKLYSCRRVTGNGIGFTRFDAATLEPEVAYTGIAGPVDCPAATDGSRIYVFADRSFFALDPGNPVPAYTVSVDTGTARSEGAVVLDGSGRAFVFLQGSVAEGNSVLVAVDTATRRVLWRVVGAFQTTPVVAGGTLYVGNGDAAEARSAADGSLLWRVRGSSPSGLGVVSSPLVATSTHLFLASSWTTDAIDLQTRTLAWSESFGGALALSQQGVLYMSPAFTTGLRAINLR